MVQLSISAKISATDCIFCIVPVLGNRRPIGIKKQNMTSLSAQLKRLTVPQSRILEQDRKRASLLFQPSDAARLSGEVIFSLGCGGLEELCEIEENVFREFESSLFSETSQRIQRAVLSKEENQKLNRNIERFLLKLTPYFLLRSAQKSLEWLIFRFYIHQFNMDSLLRLAMPFHESNTFIRLVQIIEIPENDSKWGWLIPFQKSQLPVRRQILLNRCSSERSFLGFVCDTPSFCLQRLEKHEIARLDILFTFYASVVIGTLELMKSVDDSVISQLIPHVAAGLKSDVRQYCLASYMIISQLGTRVQLEASVVRSLLRAIISKLRSETASGGLATVAVLCQTQSVKREIDLPKKAVLKMIRKSEKLLVVEHLANLSEQSELKQLVKPLLSICLAHIRESDDSEDAKTVGNFLCRILTELNLSNSCATILLDDLLNEFKDLKSEETLLQTFVSFFKESCQALARQHPRAFDSIFVPDDGRKLGGSKKEFLDVFQLETVSPMGVVVSHEAAEENPPLDQTTDQSSSPSVKKRKKIAEVEGGKQKEKEQQSEAVKWWRRTVRKLEKEYTVVAAKNVPELFVLLENCFAKDGEYYKKEYALQLVLGSLEAICTEQQEASKLQAKDFRVALVVDCIRSDRSPQTHHAALRLLTEMAKLFKEEVVGHVMSVFTFMGTGVMKKDDSYSFQIVQKTLDTVVPALFSAEKSDENEKRIKVVDTLRVFAVALSDVPEHRRLTLCTRLMKNVEAKNEKIRNVHLWIMIALLFEQHVAKWRKSRQTETREEELGEKIKDLAHKDEEFILEFAGKFPAVDQLNCALMLLRYLNHLSESAEDSFFKDYPQVFEKDLHLPKQLNHFRYLVAGFLGNLLTGKDLIAKVADLGDEDTLSVEIGSLSEEMLDTALRSLHYASGEMEKTPVDSRDRQYWKAITLRSEMILKKMNSLLPASVCLNVIKGLLSKESLSVRKNALDLMNSKLQQHPTPFTLKHIPKLANMAECLSDWLAGVKKREFSEDEILLSQSAAFTLKLLVRVVSPFDKRPLEQILNRCVAVAHSWESVNTLLLGNVALCLAELVVHLGVFCLSKLPVLIPDLLAILESAQNETNELLMVSVLTCLQKTTEHLAQFLSPHVAQILENLSRCHEKTVLKQSSYSIHITRRFSSIRKHLAALPGRTLLTAVESFLRNLSESNPESLKFVFQVLGSHIKGLKGHTVSEELNQLVPVLIEALELRSLHTHKSVAELNEIEDGVIDCTVGLSLKLSENTFRPLIFRLTDWAEQSRNAEASGLNLGRRERLITFHRLMNRLADELKSLFILFAGRLIKMDAEILDQCNFSKTDEDDRIFPGKRKKSKENVVKTDTLIRTVLDVLSRCCQYDTERQLITRDKFEALSQPIVDQLDNVSVMNYKERTEECLIPCVVNLASIAEDDSVLKSLNYKILVKTRSEKAKVRKSALMTIEALCKKLGEDVVTLLPETVPFLAEALEDENEEVESSCQKVVAVLEGLLGDSLQQYF